MKYEIDIFHHLNIYKKERKKMIFLIMMVMFITGLVSHLRPVTYRSTTIALSSDKGGQIGAMGKFLGLSMGGGSSNDIIFSILKSRRMRNDIDKHFNLRDKPNFWWELDTYVVTGGFAVEVKGSNAEMTEKIANFAVDRVDDINDELDITTEKHIVKVLDPAIKGSPIKKHVAKRVTANGLFVFLIYTLFIFFREYFSHLKRLRKQ